MSARAKTRNATTETPEHVRRVQGLRSSSAASPHATGRTWRDRDRGRAKRTAIRESE
jgi:hypothetical protein